MTTVWRLQLKSGRRNVDHTAARNFAIENNILGAGWALADEREPSPIPDRCSDVGQYLKYAKDRYSNARAVTTAASFIGSKMCKGDYVWMHAPDLGEYWCGKVNGDFMYRCTKEAYLHDLHLTRPCKWVRAGVADEVPGVVRRAFAGPSGTVSRIVADANTALEAAKILHGDIQRSINGDLFAEASPDDLEDIVALYLQSQGWWILPSTAKTSTACYEFVAVHPDTKRRCGVQVKSGKVPKLDLQVAKSLDEFFVMMADPKAKVVEHKCVTRIPCEEIVRFARKNWRSLPRGLQKRWPIGPQ